MFGFQIFFKLCVSFGELLCRFVIILTLFNWLSFGWYLFDCCFSLIFNWSLCGSFNRCLDCCFNRSLNWSFNGRFNRRFSRSGNMLSWLWCMLLLDMDFRLPCHNCWLFHRWLWLWLWLLNWNGLIFQNIFWTMLSNHSDLCFRRWLLQSSNFVRIWHFFECLIRRVTLLVQLWKLFLNFFLDNFFYLILNHLIVLWNNSLVNITHLFFWELFFLPLLLLILNLLKHLLLHSLQLLSSELCRRSLLSVFLLLVKIVLIWVRRVVELYPRRVIADFILIIISSF